MYCLKTAEILKTNEDDYYLKFASAFYQIRPLISELSIDAKNSLFLSIIL